MDNPPAVHDRHNTGKSHNMLPRLFFLIIGLWLINVLFVASHEAGHGIIAMAFGSKIFSIYISPMGVEGSITHTVLPDIMSASLVLSGGLLSTTLLVIAGYLLKLDLVVYVLSLRTIECLVNFTPGSDIYQLISNLGISAYILAIAVIAINAICAGSMFYRLLDGIQNGSRIPWSKKDIRSVLTIAMILPEKTK